VKKALWLPLLAAIVALAVACGANDTGPTSSATPRTSPQAGATQPQQFPATSYMAELQKRGKIVIGVKFDAPPMGRLNPVTNKAEGFDVDMGREIAKALFGDENKAEFIEAISANRIPFLREDKADLVISTMTITDARKLEIDFSNIYYKAGQSILVPKDSTIQSVNDLNGKRVCSAQGSTSEQNVRQRAPQAELVLFGGYAECLTALQSRRVDAITTDDTILAGIAAQDRNTKLVGGIFTEEPYGIGFKQGHPEFVAFVNKIIDDMIADGRWVASYNKWLGEPTGVSSAEALKRFR
jgi:ABC-type amino acid transport substrate-binding protein